MPKPDQYADLYADLAKVYADEEEAPAHPSGGADGAGESGESGESGGERVQRCHRCRHYYISHDPKFPYGCHALGFKSHREPIREVIDASHSLCLYYEEKPRSRG